MGAYTLSIGTGYYVKLIIYLILFIAGIVFWKKKKGKKVIVIPVTLTAGILLLRSLWNGVRIFLEVKAKAASAVSIIGGADGPTSVFLAGKVSGPTDWQIALIVVLMVIAAGAVIAWRNKKKKRNE